MVYPPRGFALGGGYSPLGLPYIASVLEGRGYSVAVIDADMEGLSLEGVASVVKAERPLVAGVSVLTHALPAVRRLVGLLKSSGIAVVVGGPHVTADPAVVSDLDVVYGLRGEAEYSFPRLFEHILDGTPPEDDVRGLVYRDGGVLKSDMPFFLEDINVLPRPARHLLRTRDYRYTVVFSSRGCPYECMYCAEQCRRVRFRNPVDVVDELEELAGVYGIRRVDFGDGVFTLNEQHVLDICGLIERRGLKLEWSCITRADLVNQGLLRVMRKSGCGFVSFGVESGVEDVRFNGGKRIPDDRIREAFSRCRSLGIKTRASIIFGTPGETVVDMKKSIEFVRELKPDYALFSVTQLFPGTRLFENLLREGRIDRSLWRDYMLGLRPSLDYIPDGVTSGDMRMVMLDAFRRFYLDWGYMARKLAGVSSVYDLREIAFLTLAKAGVIPVVGDVDCGDVGCISRQY